METCHTTWRLKVDNNSYNDINNNKKSINDNNYNNNSNINTNSCFYEISWNTEKNLFCLQFASLKLPWLYNKKKVYT